MRVRASIPITVLTALLGTLSAPWPAGADEPEADARPVTRLHWFIPDGMRADPELFDIYRWAKEGKLPNLRRLMERGAYGFSIPTFPSHTPTNFATLLTGAYPERHGIADGPMRIQERPLARPAVGGFSSAARRVPAVWSLLGDAGWTAVVLSVPGSTPPELDPTQAATIRGRWGGWGADFTSLIFEPAGPGRRQQLGRGARLFYLGDELTRFVTPRDGPTDPAVRSFSPLQFLDLDVHGTTIVAALVDTADDGRPALDALHLPATDTRPAVELRPGEWSDWLPVTLHWKERPVAVHVKVHVITLDETGFFRLRVLVDVLNRFVTSPPDIAEQLGGTAGPMVDFVDNFPPQLIGDGDRQVWLDEAKLSLVWHRDAVPALYSLWSPDLFVHDIYTPNQMLTARFWLGSIDPKSARYEAVDEDTRAQLWSEVHDMYRGLDDILGAAMAGAGDDAMIVLSSDHGAIPLDRSVRLNNLFARRGWLSYSIDEATGEPRIDWAASRVVHLTMVHVYIHPDGLGGDWHRASGERYEALRAEVTAALSELEDDDGGRPVCRVLPWEEAGTLRLPGDRVGDLVLANCAGYGWSEEITADGAIFGTPPMTGYKQGALAAENPGLWAPFVIAGPGVKAGMRIPEPISMVDQLPTILHLLGQPIPEHVQGRVIDEILE
jgi:predicted AlkP superfamily phosphohydrolase/phosphomutase